MPTTEWTCDGVTIRLQGNGHFSFVLDGKYQDRTSLASARAAIKGPPTSTWTRPGDKRSKRN